MAYTFSEPRVCPECGTSFGEAEQRKEYDPVLVVVCPSCAKLLWRPGFDEDAALVVFDPDADAGGI